MAAKYKVVTYRLRGNKGWDYRPVREAVVKVSHPYPAWHVNWMTEPHDGIVLSVKRMAVR